jgi:outer membrane protein assembly factor BamB
VYLYGNWLAADAAGGAYDAVACLNAVSGAVVWQSQFPVADRHAEVRAQGSTPCINNGRLYLVGRKRAYCLDTSSGKVLWQQPIETSSGWLACSFAVVDGVAIMICQGVYGFDALTGQLRWRFTEAPGPWNDNGGWGACPSPVPWRHEGKNYVVCCCRYAELIDPATGQAIWKIPWVEGSWSSWAGNSTPAIIGDLMVLNQKAGEMEGYTLSLESPKKLWHIPDHDCGTSPLIYQGNVYMIGGGDYGKITSIRCADLLSGKVSWSQRVLPQGCSSPIAVDGKILSYVQFGRMLCMWKSDPEHYTPLATATVKADGYSSLAFADGRLYLRLSDGVACYDVTRAGNP